MGPTHMIQELLATASISPTDDDQRFYTTLFLKQSHPIVLDYNGVLFQNLAGTKASDFSRLADGRIGNKSGHRPCFLHGNGPGLPILKQLFFKQKVIYDIGVNHGQSTIQYLKQGYNVVGVEANASLCKELKLKFKKEIQHQQFVLIQGAIVEPSYEGTDVELYINDVDDEWSSIYEKMASRKNLVGDGTPYHKEIVPVVHLNTLYQQYGCPYYLKIDIEDADTWALQSIQKLLPEKPKYVSIELNKSSDVDILNSYGYTKFKLVGQKENNQNGHWSAGKFGEEVSNIEFEKEWVEIVTIHKLIKKYLTTHSQFSSDNIYSKEKGQWFDLHATF